MPDTRIRARAAEWHGTGRQGKSCRGSALDAPPGGPPITNREQLGSAGARPAGRRVRTGAFLSRWLPARGPGAARIVGLRCRLPGSTASCGPGKRRSRRRSVCRIPGVRPGATASWRWPVVEGGTGLRDSGRAGESGTRRGGGSVSPPGRQGRLRRPTAIAVWDAWERAACRPPARADGAHRGAADSHAVRGNCGESSGASAGCGVPPVGSGRELKLVDMNLANYLSLVQHSFY